MASSSSLPFTSSLSPPSSSSPSLPFVFLSTRPRVLRLSRTQPSLSFTSSSSLPSRIKKVSTAPVEQALSPEFDFAGEVSRLDSLRSSLKSAGSLKEKLRILDADTRVKVFFKGGGSSRVLSGLGKEEVLLIKCLVAAGQGHVLGAWEEARTGGESGLRRAMHALGDMVERWSFEESRAAQGSSGMEEMRELLPTLSEIEQFYDCIGGIIG